VTTSHRSRLSLLAVLLVGGWVLPAIATELPVPPAQKIATVAAAKKHPRHNFIRIASSELPPSRLCIFPIVVGISY
jgi:hypothetical protein